MSVGGGNSNSANYALYDILGNFASSGVISGGSGGGGGGGGGGNPYATTCPTSGNSVTISSPCRFDTGIYTFTGTLTISAAVTALSNYPVSGQVVLSSDAINITSSGSVNADNRGYTLSTGPGAGTGGSGGSAGTYGGLGGHNSSAPYGSVANPTDLGSGSADVQGGGAIKLIASTGTLTIDGNVYARSSGSGGCSYNGGSGGSVWLQAATLAGSGNVSVNGGDGISCSGGNESGGGGGRIASHYSAGSPTIAYSASGGNKSNAGQAGGAGTVYVSGPTAIDGTLTIDTATAGAQATTLPSPSSQTYDRLTIKNAASLELASGKTLSLNAGGAIFGTGSAPSLTVDSGATLALLGAASISGVNVTNHGAVTGAVALTLASTTLTEAGTSFASLSSLTMHSGANFISETNNTYTLGDVIINSGANMTHLADDSTRAYVLDINASSFNLASGGTINLNGRGFTSGNGAGAAAMSSSGGAGGAGYGGAGGNGTGTAGGSAYGSQNSPSDLGSGGGMFNTTAGGAGGGILHVHSVGNVTINGSVFANGGDSGTSSGAGGGSGGSVWIETTDGTLSGNGAVTANGGSSGGATSGCGAGGRIAFAYNAKTYSGTPTVTGGGTNCHNHGSVGTITQNAANPTPTIINVSPASKSAGAAGFTLTVNGTNFIATSVVKWGGSNRTTTYVSPTQLTSSIGSGDVAAAGTVSVTVFNPTPGGGTSGSQAFSINNPVPTNGLISPAAATVGGSGFTLTVNGTNFVSTSVVKWGGSARTTTYVSPTQLTASISSGDVASVGSALVTVFNPTPGGGTSGAQTFMILGVGVPLSIPEIASVVFSTEESPGTLTADGDFAAPSSVIGTQGPITPNAGSSLNAYAHIIARDSNGWQDIDPDSVDPGSIVYGGYLKHSALGACSAANEHDCYVPFSFGNCALIAHSAHAVQVRCAVSLSYYTESGTWDLSATVADRAGVSAQFAGSFAVNPVLAYRLDTPTIDFGTVAALPLSGITNSNKAVVLTNIGNTNVAQLEVDHTAMACLIAGATFGGSIPASDMAYGTAAIASLAGSYTRGTAVGIPFTFLLPAQTDATLNQKTVFNHLVGVPDGTSGSCSGAITLTPSS
jgi:hypothetical protein